MKKKGKQQTKKYKIIYQESKISIYSKARKLRIDSSDEDDDNEVVKAKPQIIESDNSDANNSGADTPMSSTKSESSSTTGAKVGKKKVRVLQSSEEEKGNHL